MNSIKERIEEIADLLIGSTVEGSQVWIKSIEESTNISTGDLVITSYRIEIVRKMPYDNKGID